MKRSWTHATDDNRASHRGQEGKRNKTRLIKIATKYRSALGPCGVGPDGLNAVVNARGAKRNSHPRVIYPGSPSMSRYSAPTNLKDHAATYQHGKPSPLLAIATYFPLTKSPPSRRVSEPFNSPISESRGRMGRESLGRRPAITERARRRYWTGIWRGKDCENWKYECAVSPIKIPPVVHLSLSTTTIRLPSRPAHANNYALETNINAPAVALQKRIEGMAGLARLLSVACIRERSMSCTVYTLSTFPLVARRHTRTKMLSVSGAQRRVKFSHCVDGARISLTGYCAATIASSFRGCAVVAIAFLNDKLWDKKYPSKTHVKIVALVQIYLIDIQTCIDLICVLPICAKEN
ncbi:hypothetical protein B0H11DRAFT_1925820 [Mycena galericulata]|nr:hypothetical protein B0H11DRAFT_1925820 [Mycena galericulata]